MFYGTFLSFAAYACYSFSDVFIKLVNGYGVNVPPYAMAYFYALVGIAAIPFIKTAEENWRDVIIPRNWLMWLLRATASTTGLISAIVAFSNLSMAETYTLIFMQPAVASLFSILLLKERVDWRRWLAIAVGFAGVLVVMRPFFRELNIGHFAAIACCLSNAAGIIIVRRMHKIEKRITLYVSSIVGVFLVGGLMTQPLFGVALLLDMPAFQPANIGIVSGLLAYSLLAVLGTICLLAAAKRVPVTFVSLPQYSQIGLAIVFDYTLFNNPLEFYVTIGIVLIVASNLMTFLREEKHAKNDQETHKPRPVHS